MIKLNSVVNEIRNNSLDKILKVVDIQSIKLQTEHLWLAVNFDYNSGNFRYINPLGLAMYELRKECTNDQFNIHT
jgi:hypothetical protein